MISIKSTVEEAQSECPLIIERINIIKRTILKTNFDDSKVNILYVYGFFVPKKSGKEKEDLYKKMIDDSSKMIFDDRLKFEMSKLRIDVVINMGNFTMENRLPDGHVPTIIKEMVSEITKVKMMLEESDDLEIYNSIPPLSGLVKVEFLENGKLPTEELDMDDILDKISNYGMDSLTKLEKEFLDKKSKNI